MSLYGSHMEEKYNRVEQILVWSRKHKREELEKFTLPEIREIYFLLENAILSKIF